jgi:hypothetical protein
MSLVSTFVYWRMLTPIHVDGSLLIEILDADHDDFFVFDEFDLHRVHVGVDESTGRRLRNAGEFGIVQRILVEGRKGRQTLLGQRQLALHELVETPRIVGTQALSVHHPYALDRGSTELHVGRRQTLIRDEHALLFERRQQPVRPPVARRAHADRNVIAQRQCVAGPTSSRHAESRAHLHLPRDNLAAVVRRFDSEIAVWISQRVLGDCALESQHRVHIQSGVAMMSRCR